ncbi:maltose phosphorylase, putative [Talaromyces stipitatus ATCC 10500]|uniref:alpha,alpha-trehalase n=1 Tax=Talaromyces stipitatus (strain ATCC 10500 / CBS 375.48 / QM 6759 / NRRL 1006) TaxID=441959 RepID=B8MP05_TALSN|nr:maltose phosphorylase, putative [Talaromyces stipitatus ATCC 10500]EED14244.1 maltose phosphorylase, putative [Talaromyces stipitatus ATCC 10500]
MLKSLYCIGVVSLYYVIQGLDISRYQQTLTDHAIHCFDRNEGLKSTSLPETDNWNWVLETNQFVPNQYQRTPYISNGYIGQRLPAEGVGYWIDIDKDGEYVRNSWPLDQPRATFGTVAGFWNLQSRMKHVLLPDNLKKGGESVLSGIPDWTGLILTTRDGHAYRPGVDKKTVVGFQQSLSVRNGLVHTNVTWSPTHGLEYQLNFTVLAHRARPNVGIVRLDLSANKEVNCSIIDILDGAGAVRAQFNDKAFETADNAIWTSVKPRGINYKTAHIYSTVTYESSDEGMLKNIEQTRKDATFSPWASQNASTVAQSWDILLKNEQSVTFYKYVGIASDDAFPHAAHKTAIRSALEAKATGWHSLLEEHESAWSQVWDSADIIIPGDTKLQTTVRASLFHILTNLRSESEDKRGMSDNSITVGGLSSDSYAGLVFWDADTWVYPSMLALHRGYASTINNYRGRLLPQAIKNAQFYNYSGALYPWTSGRFGNCTGTGVCKDYQYHLNTDIALAHWQYFQSTHDTAWLRNKGWPVIKNVADMFAAYVVLNETTQEYKTILLGEPDEFAYFKNNGAYTNAGIKRLLGDIAPAAAKTLNHKIPRNWSRIAEKIRIPIDDKSNITLGFDGMQGDWKVKQASVALLNYPLQYQISEDHTRNDMAYYSLINTADGPAMTWSIFAISEAQLQESGCAAYTYLLRSGEPYFRQPFYQFSETAVDNYENSDDFNPAFPFGLYPAFPFLTGAGGYLQVFTHGLTGMRPHLDYLFFDPTLPPQIPEGIIVKGIKWQGASFDISIQLDYTTIGRRKLSVSADKVPAAIRIGKQNLSHGDYKLLPGEILTIPTRRPDRNNLHNGNINLALCKPIDANTGLMGSAEQSWVFGRYPSSAVDGSNATVWQPLSPEPASISVALEQRVNVSQIIINWGSTPAYGFTIHGHKGETDMTTTSILYHTSKVEISAPYNSSDVYEVKIREGNTTIVQLPSIFEATSISLTIEGTQGEEQRLGATVAEMVIL